MRFIYLSLATAGTELCVGASPRELLLEVTPGAGASTSAPSEPIISSCFDFFVAPSFIPLPLKETGFEDLGAGDSVRGTGLGVSYRETLE